MERKIYYLGLTGKCKLSVEENRWVYDDDRGKNGKVLVECNTSDKSMRLCIKKVDADEYDKIDEDEIEKGVKKVLNEDGSRWEGDWYNQQPFGFGSIYDGEGNRIYSGFMFEGKKIGFGTEYFADNHKVDYCGNFMNDLRHGWGVSYDRNGQKLYEGDWRCGKNDFEDERIVIEDNCEEDDWRIHDLMKELEIGNDCFIEWKDDLLIENYPNLQSIVVKNSLQNLKSLKICNCEKLKIIKTEDGDWTDGAFYNVKNVIIDSI